MELFEVAPPEDGPSLVLHGGAGGRVEELALDGPAPYDQGLLAAYQAGWRVLASGGAALDAVCAAVAVLEDDPLFNAGRGASLTATGRAELDASVMTGDGRAGAVAASRYAKNPVHLARAVMEHTDHVLMADPAAEFAERHGLELADPAYFLTDKRQRQLKRVLAAREEAVSRKEAASREETVASGPPIGREEPEARHGTVGAAARDAHGKVAAATSTGGMVGQSDGRVGDTPIVGAGVYARDGVVAISCTGHGEAFMRGVIAYDVAARVRYAGTDLATAVRASIEQELESRGSAGGIIAVAADGRLVVAHNSPAMFSARGTTPTPDLTL